MEDNVEMLVMNVLQDFISDYLGGIVTIDPRAKKNDKVIKSVKVIIRANMAQGDALTYETIITALAFKPRHKQGGWI